MNSVERREKRYLRRKEKRQDKIDIKSSNNSNIQEIFTFKNVFDKARRCTRNVGYKKSTINFKLHMFSIVSKTCNDLKNDCYIVGDTYKFQINERGKIRDIDAPHIKDRLVHKVISNDILIPIYDSKLIYDNGASSIGKGFSFAIKRVKKLLRKWYLKHGMNGYIVLVDFSKFFENCNHDVIKSIHNKYIKNEYIDSRASVPVRIDGRFEAELISKAKRVLALQRKGVKLIFPDVLKIEKELLGR